MTDETETETLDDEWAELGWPPPWLTEALQTVPGRAHDEELDEDED